jgi:hypothetical protein
MKEETHMFDLFPDVGHLMFDAVAPDVAHRRELTPRSHRGLPLDRARTALGRRLIAIGAALAVEERAAGRSPAR